jgi:FlaA1/EpsC-like NDP-sugar epimerase
MKKAVNKILHWYFSRNALPYWCVLLLDMLTMLVAGIFTYWIFIYKRHVTVDVIMLGRTLCMYVLPILVGARMFHTYSGIVRYSSFIDLLHIAYANIVSLIVAYAWHHFVWSIPTTVFYHLHFRHIVLMYIIGTALMWSTRLLVKSLYEVLTTDANTLRTFIYGVKEGGVGLAKNISSLPTRQFVVKGFISPEEVSSNVRLMGERIYNIDDRLETAIRKARIKAVLVPSLMIDSFRNNIELQDLLLTAGVKIYMARQAQEMDSGREDGAEGHGFSLREVSVEDLLPRDQIHVDMKSVQQLLSGRRVLITGCAGSIGSELVRQIALCKPSNMLLVDQAETPEHNIRLMMARDYPDVVAETVVTSICKADRMEQLFAEFRPEYVFHAAAYKHVPMMEDNPSEAVQNNIYGTKVIADLSVKYGVRKFVMVSTDKAVNPTNVMGCSKRICEIYVQSLDSELKWQQNKKRRDGQADTTEPTQFVTTRFGNVLGSNGSVIPLFREQIRRGGPVTVTDPRIVRYFMLIPEACKLVLEAGTKGNGGEIFVFDMGKPVKIADLAQRMIQLSGATNVEIQFIGLRPGEKLYEEVLNVEEGTKPSFHEKIRIAEIRPYDYSVVNRQVAELIETASHYDNMATVSKMKEMVPEYKSNNSVYEKLDNQKEKDKT